MAQIDVLTAQVASIIQALNDMNANARKTSEFPAQDPIVLPSLIRVEESGVSKYVTINQIVSKASSFLQNELLYFSGATVAGNTVTALLDSAWRIDGDVYSNAANIIFNSVPYTSAPGLVRNDLYVGDDLNGITRIEGDESDIAIKPPHDIDTVIVFMTEVTDTSVRVVMSGEIQSISFNVSVAGTQDFTLPDGALCRIVHVNEAFVPKKDTISNGWVNNWEQSGNTVTLKKLTAIGNRIHINYNF